MTDIDLAATRIQLGTAIDVAASPEALRGIPSRRDSPVGMGAAHDGPGAPPRRAARGCGPRAARRSAVGARAPSAVPPALRSEARLAGLARFAPADIGPILRRGTAADTDRGATRG